MKPIKSPIFSIILTMVLFFFSPMPLKSQVKKGFGGDAGMSFNSNQEILLHCSFTYNWIIHNRLILSTGGMFMHSKLNESWDSYSLTDNMIRLNSVSSVAYTTPTLMQTGLYGKGSFLFSPIPVNYISIDKYSSNISTSKGKIIYSGFIPGAFLETGIYHNFIKGNHTMKLFLGIGYGWYDPYADYRSTTIDGQKLSAHIPNDKNYYQLSLKVIGL